MTDQNPIFIIAERTDANNARFHEILPGGDWKDLGILPQGGLGDLVIERIQEVRDGREIWFASMDKEEAIAIKMGDDGMPVSRPISFDDFLAPEGA